MKKLIFLFLTLAFCLNLSLFAQKQAANWYFSGTRGMQFNGKSCLPDSFLYNAGYKNYWTDACASISDENGNLLLFTNEDYLFNSKMNTIKNSDSLFPSLNGYNIWFQPLIFLPNPEQKNIYYLIGANMEQVNGWGFPVPGDPRNGVRYSVIDLNGDNGNGEVIQKSVLLFDNTCDKLTAVHHSNGKDIWVITHDFQSAAWRSFLFTKDGFTTPPVISISGDSIHSYYNSGNYMDYETMIKASPDGRLLIHTLGCGDGTELLQFDNSTGKFGKYLKIGAGCDSGYVSYIYGFEFSPDSKKLYACKGSNLIHLDLTVFDSAQILNSQKYLGAMPTNMAGLLGQLTPDFKIAILYENTPYIGMIECPNMDGPL